jgi:hypothetical protein
VKTILEFDGREERIESLQAQCVLEYLLALDAISNEIRRRWKYCEYETEEARKVVDEIHDFIAEETSDLPYWER